MLTIMAAVAFWTSVFTVLYVLVGYPLLVTVLARLRCVQQSPDGELPSVTLLIAAYNEQEHIGRKLENSLSLEYPGDRLQILVAADGSTDRTVEIVRGYADHGVELSYSPERHGKMGAIDAAMGQVRGSIVVFSDANNVYSPQALQHLAKPFFSPNVGAVSGAKHIIQDGDPLAASEGLYWKYESFLKRQETRLGSCVAVAGEILAIRRSLYRPPPDDIVLDDFYIAMTILREGHRIVYEPEAQSFEAVSPLAADERERRARNVAGRYQAMSRALRYLTWRRPVVAWQVVSHKFLRAWLPLAMLGALLSNLVLVLRPDFADGIWALGTPFGEVLLGLQVSFYLLGMLGCRVGNKGAIGRLIYLPSYLISSNWASLVGLVRHLRGSQSAAWDRVARRKTGGNPR